MAFPQVSISNQGFGSVDDLLAFCRAHQCRNVEYTFRRTALVPEDVAAEIPDIETLLTAGLHLRYHLAFSGLPLGHPDADAARRARLLHAQGLRVAADLGGAFATLHLGLGLSDPATLDHVRAVADLAALAEQGGRDGVGVCLENLRRGRIHDPDAFETLLDATGALATLDVGHAMAREAALGAPGLALDYVRRCGPRIRGAHVYEIEKVPEQGGAAYHVAPHDLTAIGPVLDALLEDSACDWWLVELQKPGEIAHALGLLRAHLARVRPTGGLPPAPASP